MSNLEIKASDLPKMSESDFTANDFICILDDGLEMKWIPRTDFFNVVKIISKGDKGDQGVAGAKGAKGDKGDKGDRGLTGIKGDTGATGATGANGTNGTNGWSPIFEITPDGERLVLRVKSWTGGTGAQPQSGMYIGSSGMTNIISQGVDIRGSRGLQGLKGDKGDKGDTGSKGDKGDGALNLKSVSYNDDNSIKITKDDDTFIESLPPNKLLNDTGQESLTTSVPQILPSLRSVKYLNDGSFSELYPPKSGEMYSTTTGNLKVVTGCLYSLSLSGLLDNQGLVEGFIGLVLTPSTQTAPNNSKVSYMSMGYINKNTTGSYFSIPQVIFLATKDMNNSLNLQISSQLDSNVTLKSSNLNIEKLT